MESMRKVLNELLKDDLYPGEVVADARIALEMSQEELAEITGIARPNISALERSRIEMTAHYAQLLAAALNLHPADVLFPNRRFVKTDEILKIEKKSAMVLKRKAAQKIVPKRG